MSAEVEMFGIWPQLLAPPYVPLISAVAGMKDLTEVAGVARLRKSWPVELVRGALELVAARRKAKGKLDDPARWVADVEGVEQASSLDVARHKARRFQSQGISEVADLCCGIGGDAVALAEVCGVRLFDLNPQRAWMARHNTGCPVAVADVTTLNLVGRPYHIDPDRRSGGRRVWHYEDYLPPPSIIERLARGDGAVKLSPGVEFEKLPPGEIEVINRRGTLVQAVLWTGRLARHQRTATRIGEQGLRLEACGLDRGDPHAASDKPQTPSQSLHGTPDQLLECVPPMRYLLAVDPAVERAGLMGELGRRLNLPAIHPSLGLLTSESVPDSPWLTPFELFETLPWRIDRIRGWLAAHDGGVIEVKTRGGAINPDEAQSSLRGEGGTPWTVFALRIGPRITAYITRRVGKGAS